MFKRALIAALALAASPLALADDDKAEPKAELGGTVFASYGYDLTDDGDDMAMNKFAIDRAYLIGKARLGKGFATRITVDAGNTGAGYFVFLKHAYMEYSPKKEEIKSRFGMVETPYTSFADDFWGHRYVSKSFADSQGLLPTADLGVSAMGKHQGGLIDWHAAIVNGEGYKADEVDSGKSVQGRLTVDALAKGQKGKLPITVYVNNDKTYDQKATLTYAGAVGYKVPRVTFWAEYIGVNDQEAEVKGSGFSVAALPGLPKYGHLIVRYDKFDPNTDVDDDGNSKMIVGASHDFADKVALAATFEQTTLEVPDSEPFRGVFVHGMVGF